ncbi:MAG: hypothetical protein LUG99_00430 [Lachnospiraceae bacterium]|nr:hypothetical protein [Lachnospiraceae bacterium]
MAKGGTYNYDPGKITEDGMDRMRFELGDTMVEGGPDTCALTDEEICAALAMYPKRWKRAKLALLESICRRFAYEVDTKEGPLSFNFYDRAKLWREDYEALKAEVEEENISLPNFGNSRAKKPPYFYTGMMQNQRAGRAGRSGIR